MERNGYQQDVGRKNYTSSIFYWEEETVRAKGEGSLVEYEARGKQGRGK